MRINELRQARAKAINDARGVIDKADKDGRTGNLTAEEQAQYDGYMADESRLSKAIEQEERQAQLEATMREIVTDVEHASNDKGDDVNSRGLAHLPEYLRNAIVEARSRGDHFAQRIACADYAKTFRSFLLGGRVAGLEARALQADNDTLGGAVVAPMVFVARLIQALDDQLWIRAAATKFPLLASQSMGAPSLDADPADSDWTSELATGSEDSTMAFGRRELKPHPLAKLLKVSRKLLRIGALDPEGLIVGRLAYKNAVSQEKAFLTGDGAVCPLGVFSASALGISTSRDVSTDNTTTAITADGLINAKCAMKAPYHARAQWIFHRDAVKMITKLKNGNGDYIMRESFKLGEPDMLLGMPLRVSEYAPNTFTTGLYVGILADLSNYWIADSLDMTMQRLDELYAATNQVGFISRTECDGAPVLEEAFVRVKLG